MSEEDLRALDNTSTEEFVDSFGTFPGLFRTYFLFQCEGPFEMSCDKVPASDFIRFIHKTTAHGAGRYYEFGLGRVFEVYAEAVEELGGTVLFKTRVDSINIKDGVATGITLQNGDIYTADVIISDAGIRQTVNKLVGEDKFDASYIERINSLVPNLACIGYRWFLDAPVLKSPMIIVFPEGGLYTWDEFKAMAAGEISDIRNYVYFGTTSLYPNTAPEGKQLVYAVMSCYPDPELDPQPMLDYIKSIVQKVQPDLFDHIYKSERMTLQQVHYVGTENLMSHLGGESYGVANAIGQSGTQRPSAKSPIRNLYYVGNDAGGWGMGTDQAVDSAVNVAKMVLGS
jgi:phytoene dehydrogenase-like protein